MDEKNTSKKRVRGCVSENLRKPSDDDLLNQKKRINTKLFICRTAIPCRFAYQMF